jgi:acyl-CoA thioesterase FadM
MGEPAHAMQLPSVPALLAHRARVRTRWSDEDNHGVLNNAVYMTLMEEARHSYFDALGLLDGGRFPFVLGQANVLFAQPGRGAADVWVDVGTVHMGTSAFVQAFRVTEAESGAVWCEALARMVAVDGSGKRTALPAEFRRRVAALEGLPSEAPPAT